ncbi:MAG: hypothetical protein KUG82_16100 [Pseudomonadales bacterium]|nr:hypothetical protein [Pseudomonadales bacterium]
MKRNFSFPVLNLLFLTLVTTIITGCYGPMPTRDELATAYPDVEQGSSRSENTEVLCPYVRMLERAGLFDEELSGKPTMELITESVTSAAQTFGCATLECGTVAKQVSSGQGLAGVDIGQLHLADGVAHECGLTFVDGGTVVDEGVRQATLDSLALLADEDGHLVYLDIEAVKAEVCASQGLNISTAGLTEIKLIYAYLGGVDRGYVLHSDIVRLFNAELPETITTSWINAVLLSKVQ